MRSPFKNQFHLQRGLTLVELLIALGLSALITLAGIASLTVARQGFSSADASSGIENDARFATSVIRRLIVQAGYLEEKYAMDFGSEFKNQGTVEIEPNIKGFNNADYKENLVTGISTSVSGTSLNKSDMLVLRYQAGRAINGSDTPDETMINCSGGTAKVTAATSSVDRMTSVFHIQKSKEEPTLMCTWQNDAGIWKTEPLVQGVETMQILYGFDGAPASPDSVPETYLRADQLTGSSNAETLRNWRRVRSIRIGLVMRGPSGSAPERNVPAQYPLGAPGTMDSTGDPGSIFPAQTDGRLRQTVTFTVHLRNPQDNV